jgi:hypothetical protein
MESTFPQPTSSPKPELLVPLHLARRANRSKAKIAKAAAAPAGPSTTTEAAGSSLFL